MKNYSIIIFLFVFSFFQSFSQADTIFYNTRMQAIAERNSIPSFIFFKSDTIINPTTIFINHKDAFRLNADDEMVLEKVKQDNLGYSHSLYQQKYKGVMIEGCEFMVHSKGGGAVKANGHILKNFTLNQNPQISMQDAIDIALSYVPALEYMWEDLEMENLLKQTSSDNSATYYPSPKLLFANANIEFDLDPSNFKLTYKVEINTKIPRGGKVVYIDANTGSILKERDAAYQCLNGKACTHNGLQTIKTKYRASDSNYLLFDECRGNGIQTKIYDPTAIGTVFPLSTSNSNNWTNGACNYSNISGAGSLHWGSEMYFDYLYNEHNFYGIDGQGSLMVSYFIEHELDRAEYQGGAITIGVGSTLFNNGIPLATLDVIGHEWTHGLTEKVGGPQGGWNNEQGGLNESISDIFGALNEFYTQTIYEPGNVGDWLIAEEIITGGLRNLMDPNLLGDADAYHDPQWFSFQEKHNMGNVQNKWFYLLSEGGSGTNDAPTPYTYNVTGISKEKAAKIIFRSLVDAHYLITTSQFYDARLASIEAAKDLFGDCSNEVAQTIEAWNAVGVYDNCFFQICIDQTPPTCPNNNDGTATASIVGGTAPYTYSWSNGSTNNSLSNLSSGTYTLTVTDANGCIQTKTIEINILSLSVNTSATCSGTSTGTAMVVAQGGTQPYSYLWSNGQTNNSATNLNAGTYTVTVTDALGCFQGAMVEVSTYNPFYISTTTLNDCYASNNGSASVSVNGGTGPFIYSWSNGSSSPVIQNLVPGNYTIQVTDYYGCIKSEIVNVLQQLDILYVINFQIQNVSCFGENNGSATPILQGGTAPYTYSWTHDSYAIATHSNLAPGSYGCIVTDALGCSQRIWSNAIITEPPALNLSISQTSSGCDGSNTAAIEATATGATPGYTYSWSNGETSSIISNLPLGTYTLAVTDNNGCSASQSISINASNPDYPMDYTINSASGGGTGVEVWNNSLITLEGRVIIESGGTLIINGSRVEFSYGLPTNDLPEDGNPIARFEVRPGGKLELNGASLTGCGGDIWDGIEVRGISGGQQNNTDQGLLLIKNSTIIENAKIGAINDRRVRILRNITSGGIIQAENSTFRNNKRGIELRQVYDIPSASYFKSCDFVNNSSTKFTYSGNEEMEFVHLSDIYSVGLQANNFSSDLSFSPNKRGTAIKAEGSGIKLQDLGGTGNGDNIFSNLAHGVNAGFYDVARSIIVEGNSFENVQKGIYIQGGTSDEIKNNSFTDIPSANAIGTHTYGIFMVSSGGFKIEGNSFTGAASSSPQTAGSHGIAFENTGSQGGVCFNNTFSSTDFGIHTQDDNPALKIRCNKFANNGTVHNASAWYTNNGTLKQQGLSACQNDASKAAGNQWMSSSCSGTKSIFTNVNFGYYANPKDKDNNPTTIPSCKSSGWTGLNVTCADAIANSCQSSIPGIAPGGGGNCTDPVWVNNIIGLITDHKTQLLDFKSLLTNVKTRTDGGDTQELIRLITKIPAMSAQDLRNKLLASLPLSDRVMEALLTRKAQLPPNMLKDVLKPNAPLSDKVMEKVRGRVPALPQNLMNELEEAQTAPAQYPKVEQLEQDIAFYNSEVQLLENELAIEFSKCGNKADLISLLENSTTSESRKQLAQLYLQEKQYAQSRDALVGVNDLTMQEAVYQDSITKGSIRKENDNYIKYMSTVVDVAESGRTLSQINSSEIQRITEVKDEKVKISANAELLLSSVSTETFEHPIRKSTAINARMGRFETKEILTVNETEDSFYFSIYPNPSNGSTSISYFIPGKYSNYSIKLYNSIGQLIKTYPITSVGKGEVNIDANLLENGLYFCYVEAGDKLLDVKKIVIIK